ncbi:hypothetical protein [Amycolatopsis sp. EV170708-02-1]|uniref:hypothetical protein n=1 Tax=Amycolatopsis sp. EV170708-02-1 TaxID=2919322 RepID=UPI001F0B93DD|nr:hypothetical protein [Amycolatopsis sp. EV170708-02-1]UMP00085.1 hypothetical protein MJQ72_26675 [Amycolatopsis sp. EV170708-02-1]
MNQLDGRLTLDSLSLLHKQLQELVVMLTVASGPADVRILMQRLAGTAISLERLLAVEEPVILVYLRAAFSHAAVGRTDELRSDLLDASRHLLVLLTDGRTTEGGKEERKGFTILDGSSAVRL